MAIQMRRGNEAQFDASKMLPGEFAVALDKKSIYMCITPGTAVKLGTIDQIDLIIANLNQQLDAYLESIETIENTTEGYRDEALASKEAAASSVTTVQGISSTVTDKVDEASSYAEQAGIYATQAENAAKTAAEDAAQEVIDEAVPQAVAALTQAFQDLVDEAEGYKNQASQSATNASTSETNASTYASNAEQSKTAAAQSATDAAASATQAQSAASTAATEAATQAAQEATEQAVSQAAEGMRTEMSGYVTNAQNAAKSAQSWAVGGTSSRTGEDADNAKYWSEQAKTAVKGAGGTNVYTDGNFYMKVTEVGDYRFELSGDKWVANNRTVSGSVAKTTWEVYVPVMTTINFQYFCSSEPNYDKLKVVADDDVLINDISGDRGLQSLPIGLPAGSHTFTATFTKDSSQDKNLDSAYIIFGDGLGGLSESQVDAKISAAIGTALQGSY